MGWFRTSGRRSRSAVAQVSRLLVILSGIIILLIMMATVYEVVARYIFGRPTSWSLEVSSHLLIVVVFLAAAYAMMVDAHVGVSVVIEHVPRKPRRIIAIVTLLMAIPFLAVLIWSVTNLLLMAYQRNWHSSGVLQIPLSPFYLAMVIGSAMFGLAAVVKILDHLTAMAAREKQGAEKAPGLDTSKPG